jgi:hypothetical protein
MIYGGPGFLAVPELGSSPAPSPSPVSRLDWDDATHKKTVKERQLANEREEKGVGK